MTPAMLTNSYTISCSEPSRENGVHASTSSKIDTLEFSEEESRGGGLDRMNCLYRMQINRNTDLTLMRRHTVNQASKIGNELHIPYPWGPNINRLIIFFVEDKLWSKVLRRVAYGMRSGTLPLQRIETASRIPCRLSSSRPLYGYIKGYDWRGAPNRTEALDGNPFLRYRSCSC